MPQPNATTTKMTASSSTRYKAQVAASITKVFYVVSIASLCLVSIAILLGLIVPLCLKGEDKVLAAKLIYSAAGILIGSSQVVLGVLLSLIGLTADYDIDATMGSAKLKLASASPGLLLIICGNLLMGFSLMREFTYSRTESETPGRTTTQGTSSPTATQTGIKPMPPGGPE